MSQFNRTLPRQPPARQLSLWIQRTCAPVGWWMFAVCVTMVISFRGATCFNIYADPGGHMTVYTGDIGSMFGYAVQQYHSAKNTYNSILVGAPRANTTQLAVTRGGAVYNCSVPSNCTQIVFDDQGNEVRGTTQYDEKSDQWFGATIHAVPDHHKTVACAPRYLYYGELNPYNNRYGVGNCIVIDTEHGSVRRKEYSPCKEDWKTKEDAHNKGWRYCLAGFSAALVENGDRVGIGAAGAYYQQGKLFSQNLLQSEVHKVSGGKETASNDSSYMGYSMALGDFNGEGKQDFVVGVPRLQNKVVVLDRWEVKELANLYGDQIGEYFGYSLAVADFNDDNFDDIAVGAPFYDDSQRTFNTGRVIVHYQVSRGVFKETKTILHGRSISGSLFGMALTSIGDVNNDGYIDMAVGAPYDGDHAHGAVYIFNGKQDGIQTEISQVIQAEDIDMQLRSFGFSLSGGADQDNNQYPDIVVGCYASDKVVLLKSRPVIELTVDMSPSVPTINLNEKMCTDAKGVKVTCYALNTCLSYKGKNVPGNIIIDMVLNLDTVRTSDERVYFKDTKTPSKKVAMALSKRTEKCDRSEVFVMPDIRDTRSSIAMEMSHTLSTTGLSQSLPPILNKERSQTTPSLVKIQQYCGTDSICVPDLTLTAQPAADVHVLGSDEEVRLQVKVTNIGEDAYMAQSYVQLPPGVAFVDVSPPDTRVSCESDMTSLVTCLVGNPLKKNAVIDYVLHLSADAVETDAGQLQFYMHANSSDDEAANKTNDNDARFNVTLKIVTELILNSKSDPDQVWYNDTMFKEPVIKEEDIGPEVVHLYEVKYLGPTTAQEVGVNIHWPVSYEGGHLLYITHTPRITKGTGTCTAGFINADGITVAPSGEGDRPSQVLKQTVARSRRATDEEEAAKLKLMACAGGVPGCRTITCTINGLTRDQDALIEIRSRVWAATIDKLEGARPGLRISSEALVTVNKPDTTKTFHSQRVTTTVQYNGPSRETVPLWVYLVSVFAGVLILVILVVIMWKLGFFQRKKLPADPEQREEDIRRRSVRIKSNRGESFRKSQRPDLVKNVRHSSSDGEDINEKN